MLSADLNESREKLKGIMRGRGFSLEDREGPGFDFVGSKRFAMYLDARREVKIIESQAGLDLVGIKLRLASPTLPLQKGPV